MTLSAPRTRFLAVFQALDLPFGYEESCKLSPARLLTERCLVSFGRDEICPAGDASSPALTQILWELGAPPRCNAWFSQYHDGAEVIHFGYEADGDTIVHKFYLEYVGAARAALAAKDHLQGPVLVHRALKWKLGTDQIRETLYRLLPDNGVSIDDRLAQQAGHANAACELSRSILHQALARTGAQDMILLDVADTDSPRHSFDLQLYDAGLRLADIEAPVLQYGAQVQIPADALTAFIAQRADSILGHIASGKDASGAAFATLYYGVTGQ